MTLPFIVRLRPGDRSSCNWLWILAFLLLTSMAHAAANRPPIITGLPPCSVDENQEYGFTPLASPDGDELTFLVVNKPFWADFDPATEDQFQAWHDYLEKLVW